MDRGLHSLHSGLWVVPTHVGMDRECESHSLRHSVVPTHVGMDRLDRRRGGPRRRSPHARGDGPVEEEGNVTTY